MKQQRIEVLDITPDVAADMLDMNTHNRNIRDHVVEQLARAMLRGEWVFNGDAIRFGESAEEPGEWELKDGQHRLAAAVKANYTFRTVVVWGVEELAQETMDSGTKRTMSDMLKLRREVDTANLAAALRHVHRYLTRQDLRAPRVTETVQQLMALLDEHPDLRESVKASARKDIMVPGVARSLLSAFHYLLVRIDPQDTADFFHGIATGEDLSQGDPRLLFRERMISNQQQNSQARKLRTEEIGALMAKSWNSYREGTQRHLLVWKSGGARSEAFPLLDGFFDAWADEAAKMAAGDVSVHELLAVDAAPEAA